MEKTKEERIKEVEAEKKAERLEFIRTLKLSIDEDINNFKNLNDDLKSDKDIVKIAFEKVGAVVWFATDGLTID